MFFDYYNKIHLKPVINYTTIKYYVKQNLLPQNTKSCMHLQHYIIF